MCSVLAVSSGCEIMPRNTLRDCRDQCKDSKKSKACYEFCHCIHERGEPLNKCLEQYDKMGNDRTAANK
jgi:hypothetical protein